MPLSLTVSPVPPLISGGNSATIIVNGGSGTGSVIYSAAASSGLTCTVNGNQLSASGGAGTCSVTATKAADSNYLAATSAALSVPVSLATSTTGLSVAPTAPSWGDSVTLAATVAGQNPSGGVVFLDGSNTLGSASLINGTASFSTTGLSVGAHTLTAQYAGDSNNAASTSSVVSVTVSKRQQAALTLSANPASLTSGGTATTLSSSGGSGTGSVTYTAVASSGLTCTINGNQLSATGGSGNCTVTARKAEDGNYLAADSAPLSVPVTGQPDFVITGVSLNPSTPQSGQSFSATLTVQNQGMVNSDGGTLTVWTDQASTPACGMTGSQALGVGVLTAGASNTYTVTGLTAGTVGSKTLRAFIDSACISAESNEGNNQTVLTYNVSAATSTTTLTVSAPTTTWNDALTLNVTVAGQTPTGSVTFLDNGTTLGSATLTNGQANFATNNLSVGSHSLTAQYAGDTNNAASTSSAVSVTVSKRQQATLTLSANPASLTSGGSSTLSTTGGSGDGAVTYSATASGGATCTLNGNSLTASGAGNCAVTATKAADDHYELIRSPTVTVSVAFATSTASLSADTARLNWGDRLNLTVNISGQNPTGSVTFLDNGTTLGSATLSNGQANFTTNSLSVGSHSLTAQYAGDTNNAASTSSAVSVTVSKRPQATLTLSANPANLTSGGSSTLSTTGGSGSGAVTYSATASGGATCTLNGNQLSASGGAGSCTVTATKAEDANYSVTTSAPITVSVALATTQTTVSVKPATALVGDTVTVNATVSGGSNPSGSVSFSDNGTALRTVNLNVGQAGFSSTDFKAGSHNLSAQYSGDANNTGSRSSTAIIQINKRAQATLSVTANPSTLIVGGSATLNTTGGSGTGTISYNVTANGGLTCTIQGSTLSTSGQSGGTCRITASKAADDRYEAITATPISVTVKAVGTTDWSQLKAPITLMPSNGGGSSYGLTLAAANDELWIGEPLAKSAGIAQRGVAYRRQNNAQDTWPAANTPAVLSEGFAGDQFSGQMVVSDDWAAVAALGVDQGQLKNVGKVYLYRKQTGGWRLAQNINVPGSASFNNAQFGQGLALSKDWLAIGAPGVSQNDGAVYLYQLNGNTWTLKTTLSPAKAKQQGRFGAAVALDNGRLVVGAPNVDLDNTGPTGTIYGYVYRSGQWTALTSAKLPVPPDFALYRNGGFGANLALQGNTLVIAAPTATVLDSDRKSHPSAGRVFLYTWDDAATRFLLTPTQLTLESAQLGDRAQLGAAMGLAEQGKTLLIGAPGADSNNSKKDDLGRVLIYQQKGGSWAQVQTLQGKANQGLGRSVALLPKAAFVGDQKGQVWAYRAK